LGGHYFIGSNPRAVRPVKSDFEESGLLASRWAALGLTSVFLLAPPLAAQDVEPRALSPAPVGTNVIGLAASYSTGDVLLDKTLPVEDLDGYTLNLSPNYTRYVGLFGTTARLSAAVPVAVGEWDAFVRGDTLENFIDRTGFGDAVVSGMLFLLGGPAMGPAEFREYRRKTLLGFHLRVKVPIGQYDAERLVNLGSNRWQVAPALAFSQWIGKVTLSAYATAWLFSDNDELLGDNVLSQAPLFAFQLNAEYSFKPNLWLAAGVRQSTGGRTTVNGVEGEQTTENLRLGLVFGVPIAPRHTLKLLGTTGLRTTAGNDFDTLSLRWFCAW
jgi:hypothetical protein